jgi:hypothetical protein
VELIYIMIKLLPECSKCRSPITDSLETEIEQHGKVKTGRYTDGIWICHDCIESEEGKKKSKGADNSSPSIDQCDTIGVASASDVSPNTPRADET